MNIAETRERRRRQIAGLPVRWLTVGALLLAGAAAAIAPASGEDSLGLGMETSPPAVRAKFVLSRPSALPGETVDVGVLLTLDERWHVYWRNPGDAGLATSLDISSETPVKVGPIQWPTPISFVQPGNIAGYGYEGEVLLWRSVTIPESVDANEVHELTLRVSASWLGCREACVPGEADDKLKLTVAKKGDRQEPESDPVRQEAELFGKWQDCLPISPDDPNAPDVRVQADFDPNSGGRFRVTVAWSGRRPAKLQWFPDTIPSLTFGDVDISSGGRKTVLAIPAKVLEGQSVRRRRAVGLLAWSDREGRRRSLRIVLPLSSPGPEQPRAQADRDRPANTDTTNERTRDTQGD